MSNIFDIHRFWRYLKWEVSGIKDKYLFSILILGAFPIVMFTLNGLLGIIFTGTWKVPEELGVNSIWIAITIFILTFPAKTYGKITEKRYGSEWLMIPASPLEKTLSITVFTCVIAPVFLIAMLLVCDIALGSIFPSTYGTPLLFREIHINPEAIGLDSDFRFNAGALIYTGICCNILMFVLGSLCFKRSKAAKTLLVDFIVGLFIIAPIAIKFFNEGGLIGQIENAGDTFLIVERMKTLLWTWTGVEFLALVAAIYYRIRTIKH